MIKEKEVDIKISYRNITHYKNKGYDVNINDNISVNVLDLPNGSHYKITAICDICGKEQKIIYYKYNENKNRYNYYSCKKCANIKREKTSFNKWGVSNYRKTDECENKIKKTNKDKYGVEYSFLNEDIKEKIKNTIKDRYGVEEVLSNKDIREKIKKTNKDRYGVEYYSKTEAFYELTYKRWEKDILSKLKKYNINDFILKRDRTIDIKCDNNKEHYFNINSKNLYQRKEIQDNVLCTICNKIEDNISGKELKLKEFIVNNYDGEILYNVNEIGKEFDIYLPEIKLAFEFNGVYWHSDIYKDKDYHKNKTDLSDEIGIQLIHIWEDDWVYKQDIVKSMILNKLGETKNKIYARKTEVKEITDNQLVRVFLEENHIQGFVGSKIKLGLFYDNELVSLMTFGNNRRNMGHKKSSNKNYELLRFCNKLNTNVIGGASKLFKYFINNYDVNKITTYANRDHSNGKLYEVLGFNLVSITVPNYSYYDRKLNKYNRFNFRKDVLINMGYDKNKTSHEIMDELKYYRVYNSGNLKYEFKF